jgi:hypothetical protein
MSGAATACLVWTQFRNIQLWSIFHMRGRNVKHHVYTLKRQVLLSPRREVLPLSYRLVLVPALPSPPVSYGTSPRCNLSGAPLGSLKEPRPPVLWHCLPVPRFSPRGIRLAPVPGTLPSSLLKNAALGNVMMPDWKSMRSLRWLQGRSLSQLPRPQVSEGPTSVKVLDA